MAERTGAGATKPVVEELHYRSDQVYVCLVVNRRHRSARIVDFLAGNFPQKQAAIHQIAAREGIERVYTLVEREESAGWVKVGYAREGSIPGYYKRSDAYVMGHLVSNPPKVNPDGSPIPPVADANAAEKAMNAAKKIKDSLAQAKTIRTSLLGEAEIAAARAALAKNRKVTPLDDRFGRTGVRLHFAAKDPKAGARLGEQIVSAEVQECFGNAFLQLHSPIASEAEARVLVGGLNGLFEHLRTREVGSAFAFTGVGDLLANGAMLAAGFRKTGLLAQHLLGEKADKRVDAILWTRKTIASADADAA